MHATIFLIKFIPYPLGEIRHVKLALWLFGKATWSFHCQDCRFEHRATSIVRYAETRFFARQQGDFVARLTDRVDLARLTSRSLAAELGRRGFRVKEKAHIVDMNGLDKQPGYEVKSEFYWITNPPSKAIESRLKVGLGDIEPVGEGEMTFGGSPVHPDRYWLQYPACDSARVLDDTVCN